MDYYYVHSSASETESEEDEPVTSTVPELTGEDGSALFKSDRPSWLYRRSRTPSPKEDLDNRRVVTTLQEGRSSYKPNLVSRKNEVSSTCVA